MADLDLISEKLQKGKAKEVEKLVTEALAEGEHGVCVAFFGFAGHKGECFFGADGLLLRDGVLRGDRFLSRSRRCGCRQCEQRRERGGDHCFHRCFHVFTLFE